MFSEMKVVFYTLTMLVWFTSGAPEGSPTFKPAPVYKPAENNEFVADQPIYSPETSVALSPPTSGASSNTGISSGVENNAHLYNPEGYVENYNGYAAYDPGYGVQTGYEGYLVPTGYYSPVATVESGPISHLWSLMPHSSTVLSAVGRGISFVVSGAGILLAGAALVFGICTFTPICHIKLAGFNPLTIKEEVRAYMTPDNISTAVNFLREAVNKYKKMQKID